jgi:hypothetical protein
MLLSIVSIAAFHSMKTSNRIVELKMSESRSNPNTDKSDNVDKGDKAKREWKSGYIFVDKKQDNNRRNPRRNDPWWMREEEKNNPRMLSPYKPWWLEEDETKKVSSSWKIAEMREEAERRGLQDTTGLKKDELLEKLKASQQSCDLSDDNFTEPEFVAAKETETPPCYPQIYEGSSENIELLRNKVMLSGPMVEKGSTAGPKKPTGRSASSKLRKRT